ncbi:hypothetical protein [Halapricum desulfuricans]|nr:hypothetical protein [Halapricum desulfuricans]
MILTGVNVEPTRPQPGVSMTVRVTVTEDLSFVGPLDPDLCNPGGINTTGQQVQVRVDPEWAAERTENECIAMGNLGTNAETIEFGVKAPSSPGTYSIRVGLEMPGSGKGPEWTTTTIEVSESGWEEDSDTRNTEPDADDSGGNGPAIDLNIPNPLDGNGDALDNIQIILLLIVVIYALSKFGGD